MKFNLIYIYYTLLRFYNYIFRNTRIADNIKELSIGLNVFPHIIIIFEFLAKIYYKAQTN